MTALVCLVAYCAIGLATGVALWVENSRNLCTDGSRTPAVLSAIAWPMTAIMLIGVLAILGVHALPSVRANTGEAA